MNRFFLALMMVLFSFGFAFSRTNFVSFQEYLKRLEQSLPEWRSGDLDLKRAEVQIEQGSAYLNPQISAGVSASSGGGSSSGTLSIDQQSGYIANFAFQEVLPLGLRLNIGLDYSHIDMEGSNVSMSGLDMSTGSFNYSTNEYSQITDSPKLSVQLTLPLLMNVGGFLDSYAYRDAKLNRTLKELNLRLNRRNLRSVYAKYYYQWIYQKRMSEYLKENLKNTLLQEAQIKAKLKDGLVDPDHYESARIQRFSVEEQIRQTRNGIDHLENLLSSVMNLSNEVPNSADWEKALRDSQSNVLVSCDFDKTETAKTLDLNLKRLEQNLKLLQNQALPNLNLIGQFALNSDMTTNGVAEAFSHLNQTEAYVGVQFAYPLGNTAANAKIKDLRFAIQQLELERKKQKRDFEQRLRTLKQKIVYYRDVILLKRQALERLRVKYREEQKKYNQGRLFLSDLISTQASLISAQITLTGYEYNLIASELDYKTLIGK